MVLVALAQPEGETLTVMTVRGEPSNAVFALAVDGCTIGPVLAVTRARPSPGTTAPFALVAIIGAAAKIDTVTLRVIEWVPAPGHTADGAKPIDLGGVRGALSTRTPLAPGACSG